VTLRLWAGKHFHIHSRSRAQSVVRLEQREGQKNQQTGKVQASPPHQHFHHQRCSSPSCTHGMCKNGHVSPPAPGCMPGTRNQQRALSPFSPCNSDTRRPHHVQTHLAWQRKSCSGSQACALMPACVCSYEQVSAASRAEQVPWLEPSAFPPPAMWSSKQPQPLRRSDGLARVSGASPAGVAGYWPSQSIASAHAASRADVVVAALQQVCNTPVGSSQ
jgi:hypothetical protein